MCDYYFTQPDHTRTNDTTIDKKFKMNINMRDCPFLLHHIRLVTRFGNDLQDFQGLCEDVACGGPKSECEDCQQRITAFGKKQSNVLNMKMCRAPNNYFF
jgi:hypothetical protein